MLSAAPYARRPVAIFPVGDDGPTFTVVGFVTLVDLITVVERGGRPATDDVETR